LRRDGNVVRIGRRWREDRPVDRGAEFVLRRLARVVGEVLVDARIGESELPGQGFFALLAERRRLMNLDVHGLPVRLPPSTPRPFGTRSPI
jgi:hypothetical protein